MKKIFNLTKIKDEAPATIQLSYGTLNWLSRTFLVRVRNVVKDNNSIIVAQNIRKTQVDATENIYVEVDETLHNVNFSDSRITEHFDIDEVSNRTTKDLYNMLSPKGESSFSNVINPQRISKLLSCFESEKVLIKYYEKERCFILTDGKIDIMFYGFTENGVKKFKEEIQE